MSPRTRTASDDQILDAAARVILRLGPSALRLADVAEEIGLAPATLLQRFTSKQQLLQAVAAHGTETMQQEFADRRANAASPLDALLAMSPQVRSVARSRTCVANKLAFVQLALSDPVFQRSVRAYYRIAHREFRKLLDEALRCGELRECCTAAVAHALLAVMHGSMLLWAITRDGSSGEARVRADLEAVLAPYRTEAAPVPATVRSPSQARPRGRTSTRPA